MKPPSGAMAFIDDIPLDFQFLLSSFSVNSLIQTVIDTDYLQIPVEHDILFDYLGVDITTSFFKVIIPELENTFGNKNLSITI